MKVRSQSSSIRKKRSRRSNRAPGKSGRSWTCAEVLRKFEDLANPEVRAKMAYFGVQAPIANGVSAPVLHKLAREIGKNHLLANQLWACEVHEAKLLASLIGEAQKTTANEMEVWARAFDSWDVVDTACCYLFAGTKFAWQKAQDWSKRRELFIKRAGFSLVAYLSYKDKQSPDERFAKFLKVVERESDDDRHFVKKAVNWALRNIGKRNLKLNREAIRVAEKLRKRDSRAARWIAADALRELRSEAVQRRLRQKSLYRR
jgi:3-methyladenine DNA glycosylase AlkD